MKSRDREVLELAEKIVQLCREGEFEESAPSGETKIAGKGASLNGIEHESHHPRS